MENSEEGSKAHFTSKYLSPCRTVGLKRKSKSPSSLVINKFSPNQAKAFLCGNIKKDVENDSTATLQHHNKCCKENIHGSIQPFDLSGDGVNANDNKESSEFNKSSDVLSSLPKSSEVSNILISCNTPKNLVKRQRTYLLESDAMPGHGLCGGKCKNGNFSKVSNEPSSENDDLSSAFEIVSKPNDEVNDCSSSTCFETSSMATLQQTPTTSKRVDISKSAVQNNIGSSYENKTPNSCGRKFSLSAKRTQVSRMRSRLGRCHETGNSADESEIPPDLMRIIERITEKSDRLQLLNTRLSNARKHDVNKLKELSRTWKSVCIEALERLHSELRLRGDASISLLDLITAHSIPPDLISFDQENQEFT